MAIAPASAHPLRIQGVLTPGDINIYRLYWRSLLLVQTSQKNERKSLIWKTILNWLENW
ncbi:MAG: hypothetical protein F6K40_34075 [Okeania sp. SIO3I5]|nr:hypothetical protein [Okeania sp. SIO3I5]